MRRYGQLIGIALQDIRPGDHVHSHNLGLGDLSREYEFGTDASPVCILSENKRHTFLGYN